MWRRNFVKPQSWSGFVAEKWLLNYKYCVALMKCVQTRYLSFVLSFDFCIFDQSWVVMWTDSEARGNKNVLSLFSMGKIHLSSQCLGKLSTPFELFLVLSSEDHDFCCVLVVYITDQHKVVPNWKENMFLVVFFTNSSYWRAFLGQVCSSLIYFLGFWASTGPF